MILILIWQSRSCNLYHCPFSCPRWGTQQKELWAKVKEATKKKNHRNITIASIFANKRCTTAILDFLRCTDVRKMTEEARAGYDSEWESGLGQEADWLGDEGYREWQAQRGAGEGIEGEIEQKIGVG